MYPPSLLCGVRCFRSTLFECEPVGNILLLVCVLCVPGALAGCVTGQVVRPQVTETTALGAAYAAGLAVGFWERYESLVKWLGKAF